MFEIILHMIGLIANIPFLLPSENFREARVTTNGAKP